MVEPSAIAASKSALIPMDSVSRWSPCALSWSLRTRNCANQARWRAGSVSSGGMHMRPRSFTLRDLQPVERVHPGEMFRDCPRLVGLQAAHEVPGQREFLQRRLFFQRFLQVALAKVLKATAGGRGEGLRRLGFANGQECDRPRTPPGRDSRLCHLSEHCVDTLGQILRTH